MLNQRRKSTCLLLVAIGLLLVGFVMWKDSIVPTTTSRPCPEPKDVACPKCEVCDTPVSTPCPTPAVVDALQAQKWEGRDAVTGPLPWTESCFYKEITSPKGPRFQMCVRTYDDIVSSNIRQNGRWGDCDPLLDLWEETPRANPNVIKNDPTGIFVDAGANIGSCSLIMAAQGHTTIGFEPSRANFFYLSSGVLANNDELRSRVTLYRMGLGKEHTEVTANVAKGNAGNTVLETQVKDWPAQQFDMEKVVVGPLDDVLWSDPSKPAPHIRVLKLDVQGYEVKILQGATRLLKAGAIGIIKSEVTAMFLAGQGSTPLEMLQLLDSYGYDLIGPGGQVIPPASGTRDGEVVLKYRAKSS